MMLQAATAYQHDIARSLGLPSHKVVCHVKRVGGAFGGKETRFIPVTAAAAVAAREINRPVRIALDRHEDMAITGHRHPFFIKYKVSCCSQMPCNYFHCAVSCTCQLSGVESGMHVGQEMNMLWHAYAEASLIAS